jgi:hypothetical protein
MNLEGLLLKKPFYFSAFGAIMKSKLNVKK